MEEVVERLNSGTTSRGWILVVSASIILASSILGRDITAVLLSASTGTSLYLACLLMRSLLEIKKRYVRYLKISRSYEGRLYEKERIRVVLTLENKTSTPLGPLEVEDYPPELLQPITPPRTLLYLPPNSKVECQYEVEGFIGRHIFKNVRVVLKDPLGLFYEEYRFKVSSQIKIRPKIDVLESRILEKVYTPTFGIAKSKIKGIGLEYAGVRDYVSGDDYKRIEWKATARTGQLKTKEYELESKMRILFILDFTQTMMYGRRGITKLEYSSRAISSISRHLLRKGDYVGLVVFSGGAEYVEAPLSTGEQHLKKLLEIIASSRPVSKDKRAFPKIILEGVSKLSKWRRTLIILVTDLEPYIEDYHYSLLETLEKVKSLGGQTFIVSPYTPLFEVEIVSGLERVLYALQAFKSWSKRWEVVRLFRERGFPVLNVGPRDFVVEVVRKIEELRPLAPL